MITTAPFGSTGHESTRTIFGAAALHSVTQAEADRTLEVVQRFGVNHIDTAVSYGDSELRLGPWLERHRGEVFLATKTGERGYAEARDSIRRSLERLRVASIDLIQLHNLVKPDEWERAVGGDGALRAAIEARDEGLVRFIGVTGHGTRVAEMHRKSLDRFAFDSVLLPYNHSMMQSPEYAVEFEALLEVCAARGVAVQTIKSIARRRWPEGTTPTRTTWYEPFEDPADIERGVHWALARPGVFVNTASDPALMERMFAAAERFRAAPDEQRMRRSDEQLGVEPLFIRGFQASGSQA